MKKFLLSLIAVAGLAYYVSAEPSTIGRIDDASRNATYLTVYNEDVVDHEAGDVLIYKSGGTYPGLSVSTTTSANDSKVAGVVPSGTTLAASSWGLMQVSGYHSGVTIGVSVSTGDALVTSTTGEAAGKFAIADGTTTATAQTAVFGVALETTSGSTCKAIIKVR